AAVVPGEPAIVVGVLPETNSEVDGVDRLLRIQNHRLAVGFNLLATPRPKIRIGISRRVAKAVADRLTEGPLLRLELLASLAVFLPGLREFWRLVTDLREPG